MRIAVSSSKRYDELSDSGHCSGFNQVGLQTAGRLGLQVRRVPANSFYAIAEFAIGTILTLNREYHRAFNRIREGNFGIEGLLGFDLHGSTVGIVKTGKIGLLPQNHWRRWDAAFSVTLRNTPETTRITFQGAHPERGLGQHWTD